MEISMGSDFKVKSCATLTEKIATYVGGVVENPYQGTDKKVLFICSMGLLRSATGARLYAKRYNTRAAGTLDIALIPLNDTLIAWADLIVFVNRENYHSAVFKYGEENIDYKCKVLNISDEYEHMHPELIKQFAEQFEPLPN